MTYTNTIGDWLTQSTHKLRENDIESALLDCEILLSDLLSVDRSWLHAHDADLLTKHISSSKISLLEEQVKRRSKHEPLAYIRGWHEFYGRKFIVNGSTLTPRPETETLVVLAIDVVSHTLKPTTIVDIGTGSGCIITSIILGLEPSLLEKNTFFGTDISKDALSIAKKNAELLGTSSVIEFLHQDIRTTSPEDLYMHDTYGMIVINAPYVPNSYPINKAASQEPAEALFGGIDGLDYYRILFNHLTKRTRIVITESLEHQHQALEGLALKYNYSCSAEKDLIQVFTRI